MAGKKKGLIDSKSRHEGYKKKFDNAVDTLMEKLGGSNKKKKKKKSGGPKLDKKKVDKFDLWGK
jgi:hypothetical protein